MACNAEETDEMILAFVYLYRLIPSYTNIEAPYTEMEKQSIELRKKLKEVLNDESIIGKGVNVYYDDPRFSPEARFSRAFAGRIGRVLLVSPPSL